MSPSHINLKGKKPIILALSGLLIGLLVYISAGQSDKERLSSTYQYLWPNGDSSLATDGPPLSEGDRILSSDINPQCAQAAPIQDTRSKNDWTTYQQFSRIRYNQWAQTDRIPLSSEGALSGKGHRSSFRTNLRKDKNYFTTFLLWGFTNQFIGIYTAIYMAMLSQRIPILPPFVPHESHLGGHAKFLPVAEIFDLNRLRAVLDLPIVEMWELKGSTIPNTTDPAIEEHPEEDHLGCWSFWLASNGGSYGTNDIYKIKPSLTPLPNEYLGAGSHSPHLLDTVSLLTPRLKGQPFKMPIGSQAVLAKYNITAPAIVPDDHVACVDLSLLMMVEPDRWDITGEWASGDGAWQAVGRHLRFQPHLLDLAEVYLRKVLEVAEDQEIPPYIAVHVRRTDFAEGWKALTLRHYAHATSVVMNNIRHFLGVPVTRVIVLSDETDEEWLASVSAYSGWTVMDHAAAKTREAYGAWHPTLLDTVIMSGGIGIVGLRQSSMAIMAGHRVTEWNAGVSKLITQDYPKQVPEEWDWTGPSVDEGGYTDLEN